MNDPLSLNGLRLEESDKASVQSFSETMVFKLRKNSHKAHWGTMPIGFLLSRLHEEIGELELALAFETPEAARLECADAGNFLMMIHDNLLREELPCKST